MPPIKVAIASNSMGKSIAGHTIHHKLGVAKAHGFDGVEIAFECLEAHADTFKSSENREDQLRAAASDIFSKSDSLSLSLIAMNPFRDYDGLVDEQDVEDRLKEAELYCQLCDIMSIPILQVCTAMYTFDESKVTSDPNIIARNMHKLGILAQKYNLKIGYEAPAWGIHGNTWQHIQEVLDLVNLPNVGHCFDTFHIASREAGDPFNANSPVLKDGHSRVQKSMDEFRRTVDPSSIMYLQLIDATVADPEQKNYPRKDLSQPPLMTQSRNCRIFPCEERFGGTLPVIQVAKTVFDMGYTGWVSMEAFHADMFDTRSSVSDDWAKRGMDSWREVMARCELDTRN